MLIFCINQVRNGMAFNLRSRQFHRIDRNKYTGLLTPRVFADYDHSNVPDSNIELFRMSILNSFPDERTRIQFLNKLYQCNLGHRLPMKVSKLLVCGEQDSGKTTWAEVFYGKILSSSLNIHD